jgi:hypothetical protein
MAFFFPGKRRLLEVKRNAVYCPNPPLATE